MSIEFPVVFETATDHKPYDYQCRLACGESTRRRSVSLRSLDTNKRSDTQRVHQEHRENPESNFLAADLRGLATAKAMDNVLNTDFLILENIR